MGSIPNRPGMGSIPTTGVKQSDDVAKTIAKQGDDAADLAKKTSKGNLAKSGRWCRSNPKSCARRAGASILVGYVGYKFYGNSKDQQACISKCITPDYAKYKQGIESYDASKMYYDDEFVTDADGKKRAQCTRDKGDKCEEFCKEECKKLHPSNLLTAITDTMSDIGSFTGLDKMGSIVKTIFVAFLIILFLSVIVGIFKK